MSTYGHVLDILDDTAQQAGKASAPVLWLRARAMGFSVVLFQSRMARRAARNIREIEEMGLRLSGIARRLPKFATEMSAADISHLLQATIDTEQGYMRQRGDLMTIILELAASSLKSTTAAQSLTEWVTALADAFEAAQDLRWVIMECQAQQDVDAGRVQRYGSAAAAIAALRS